MHMPSNRLPFLDKVVEKLHDHPCHRTILVVPGWPNIPSFWDLSLPNLPNLLTQPFNQTPHRNLNNLNLHTWLLESQLSRNRASLRQQRSVLRLLKEDQPDQSMRQSGQFLQSGASVTWWTGTPCKVNSQLPTLPFSIQEVTTKYHGYRLAIANKLGHSPNNVSKGENLTRLLDSFHKGLSHLGSFPWCYTSEQRLPFNPVKRPL